MIVHVLRMTLSILLFNSFLLIPSIQFAFLTTTEHWVDSNPKSTFCWLKPLVLYVNIRQNCFPDVPLIAIKPLYFSVTWENSDIRKLRHACFCFKVWKSAVGENQRGILKGTRTEFKLFLYSVISKGCHIWKSDFSFFFSLHTHTPLQ